MINKLYQAFVNKFLGETYHKKFCAPKLKNTSKDKASLVLSYDVDEQKDIAELPWLLDLLKKHKITGSFAVIGLHVERYPKIFKRIKKEGHEIINHTYSHPDNIELNPAHFHKISKQQRFTEISKCDTIVKNLLNYKMKGFRIPHFGNQYIEDIYPMLKKLGYKFSSSTVSTTQNSEIHSKHGIIEFPITCCPKHPFCIFDTSHAFRATLVKHEPAEYLQTFGKLLNFAVKNSVFLNLYQDPQDLKKFDYEKMLLMIKKSKIKVKKYEDLLK